MKATVNGIQVEGTPKEVHEYVSWTKPNQTTINFRLGKRDFSAFVDEVIEDLEKKQKNDARIIGRSL